MNDQTGSGTNLPWMAVVVNQCRGEGEDEGLIAFKLSGDVLVPSPFSAN
jgi:hypothetical protein